MSTKSTLTLLKTLYNDYNLSYKPIVHSILVLTRNCLRGGSFLHQVLVKCLYFHQKKVPEPTPWGEIIFGHARFLIWAKT